MVNINSVTSPTNVVPYITNVELVCEKNDRPLFFSVYREITTLGSTVRWETWHALFSTGILDLRVGVFLSQLNTNNGFSLSHITRTSPRER